MSLPALRPALQERVVRSLPRPSGTSCPTSASALGEHGCGGRRNPPFLHSTFRPEPQPWLDDQESDGSAEEDIGRKLVTLLFTDIVGSTRTIASIGDRPWGRLLRQHHALVRRELARFRGREVEVRGDGFLASFDRPNRAIRCASSIVEGMRVLGLELRVGLHAGECEVIHGQLEGISVHIGARVVSRARPGEILVSRTVRDLLIGSSLSFSDRGLAMLKGVPGRWRLFAVNPLPASMGAGCLPLDSREAQVHDLASGGQPTAAEATMEG